MKRRFLFVLFLTTGLSAMASSLPSSRPNVVILYGDDVGFGDVGAYGSTMIPTPNIDRLSREGLRFTDGHCSASTCTPSRFSLLTGIYAFRYDARILQPNAPLIIPMDKLTLPQLFKRAGYHTAVIGKWHLGLGEKDVPVDWNGEVKPGPLEIGFDFSYLLPNTNDRVPCVYLDGHRVENLDPNDPIYVSPRSLEDVSGKGNTQYPDGQTNREAMTVYQSSHGHAHSVINGIGRIGYMSGGKSALWNEEDLTDKFTAKAKAYIQEHKEKPFFLYFASQDIHVPRYPHPRFRGKSKLGHRGDSMVAFDWAVGEILDTLEACGLTDNTIVIFSSDNGPVYNDGYEDGTTVVCSEEEADRGHDGSGIWRGGKYQIYEGGTRVPFLVRWPERVTPGVSDALVSQVDLLASFASLLNIPLAPEEAEDSRNMLDTFLGRDATGVRYLVEESFGLALRDGNWKYVEAARPGWPRGRDPIPEGLYNLTDDPGEQANLIADYPERAAQMKTILKQMRQGAGAREMFRP